MQASTENSTFDREYVRTYLLRFGIVLNKGETVDEYIRRCGYPFTLTYDSQDIRADN